MALKRWTLQSKPLRMGHPPSLQGSQCWHLAQQVTPRGCGWCVCVQTVLPGSTQPHRKPWGPLLGPSNATHGHSVNSPKAGTGWERVCITPGSQEGVREAQAKWELSLKVTSYLQQPNDFCSALCAFLYFNSKTDFFFWYNLQMLLKTVLQTDVPL